jgi:FtsP/CotA-like multicopper oxidase with cupredoxin domain
MLSRRALLLSAVAASTLVPTLARSQAAPSAGPGGGSEPQTVLRLLRRTIDVKGKSASVYGIQQPDGTFGLRTGVGKRFRVRVENRIEEPSLIHWHGLTPPWQQDGVPGVSGPAIPAGGSADYDFPLRFGGTFWMHSHQGLQEQLLMSAPLIIRDQRDRPDQQEVILMLADFSFTPPEQIFAELRKGGKMSSMNGPTAVPMAAGASPAAAAPTMKGMGPADSAPRGGMAMGATVKPDLNDVTYDAFLANDRTLGDPDVVKVEPGTRAARVINSSSMSAYHVDLGQLDGELIAVDGFRVAPVKARRFPIAVAQRLDIRLALPRTPASHPVLALLEGENKQTGIVLQAGRAPVARIADTASTASPALTLDLESRLRAAAPLQPRKTDRVHTLDLTGEMSGYVWSINNVVWNKDVPPLPLAKGERVELIFLNRTPMPHPMHLHGHEFQVVEIDGKRFAGAVRDTVLVPPGRRVVVAFDANNPGFGRSTATCSTISKPGCSRRCAMSDLPFTPVLSLIGLTLGLASAANAACLDLKQTNVLSLEGTLSYRIFAGPPNYEDVRKGDTPEPTYILTLAEPICASGDEFVDPRDTFSQVQIFPESSGKAVPALAKDLRRWVGKRVVVEGASPFGAHTGHHHAPLLLPITRIALASVPTQSYGTAMTTVQGFYAALSAGNGEEAAKFVIPKKRSSGPLSATAISKFYGNLPEPLTLVDVVATRSGEYRVRYRYVASGPRRCDGESMVRITQVSGANLIESIKAVGGC